MTDSTTVTTNQPRPDFETLYKALLIEVAAMHNAQHASWTNTTKRNIAERTFREQLVWTLVDQELQYLRLSTPTATPFTYQEGPCD